ncbi:hypothetical protein HQ544_01285 [Candidatus Falkowbacteria bacterium]|nr:hypothetical protein [Candidatus Falkowbacteria bacterium]
MLLTLDQAYDWLENHPHSDPCFAVRMTIVRGGDGSYTALDLAARTTKGEHSAWDEMSQRWPQVGNLDAA